MACPPLGFNSTGDLRTAKSQDTEETFAFPAADWDFTGWDGELQVRESEGAADALLTVNATATANGSLITLSGANITLLIKAADLQTLPDATDTDDPWVGVFEMVLTNTDSLTTRLVAGVFTAEKGVVR